MSYAKIFQRLLVISGFVFFTKGFKGYVSQQKQQLVLLRMTLLQMTLCRVKRTLDFLYFYLLDPISFC